MASEAEKEVKIEDLHPYHRNPRKISKEDFELLSSSLKEFGDLSGIIFNRTTNEVVGGNQRTQFFKGHADCVIVITERFPEATKPAGTVAQGYVVLEGEKFTYREVEWDEKKEERANILANKVSGTWDFDLLANNWDLDTLLATGWKSFELGFAGFGTGDKDQDGLADSMGTYLEGNVKQVVLFFSAEEFEKLLPRLDVVMTETGATSHTEVFLKLLEEHEAARP